MTENKIKHKRDGMGVWFTINNTGHTGDLSRLCPAPHSVAAGMAFNTCKKKNG